MRNQWYPSNKAEYMTAARFQELGLTRDDVGERDTTFGTAEPVLEELDVVEEVQAAPAIEIQGLPVSTHPQLSRAISSHGCVRFLTHRYSRPNAPTPSYPSSSPRP